MIDYETETMSGSTKLTRGCQRCHNVIAMEVSYSVKSRKPWAGVAPGNIGSGVRS